MIVVFNNLYHMMDFDGFLRTDNLIYIVFVSNISYNSIVMSELVDVCS